MTCSRILRPLLAATAAASLLAPAAAQADTLYVTDRQANVVHQFNIGSNGALSALTPPTVATAGVNPTGIAVSPNGRSAYVASAAAGSGGSAWFGDVSQYDVFETGALAPKRPFEAFAAADPSSIGAGVAVTGDSGSVYVTGGNGSSAGAYQFGADANGLLAALTPAFVAAVGATDVVVHPTLARAYVSLGASGIRRFDVEAGGTLGSPRNTLTDATQLAIAPNGRYLYATSGLQDVLAFAVDPSDGRLSALGTVTIPSGTVQYVAASDSSVYVSTSVGVSQYDVGGDGRLTPKTPADLTLRGAPADIALSPDGRSAYVASYINGGSILAQYDVGFGGALSPKAAGSIVVRGTPAEIAVTTAGTGGSTPPPGPPPPAPPAPPAPKVEPPARRLQINEILLYRREGGRYVGFKWDARGVRTEISCVLTREARDLCDATVEIIDLFADNVRVIHASAAARRGRRRARRPTVLARGRIRLAPGRTGTIVLRFTRAGRRAVSGRRSLTAVVLTRLTVGSEPPLVGQARAKLTLARPRPRRRGRR